MVVTVHGLHMVHVVNHVIQVLRQREELATILPLPTEDLHVLDLLHIASIVTLSHVLVSVFSSQNDISYDTA